MSHPLVLLLFAALVPSALTAQKSVTASPGDSSTLRARAPRIAFRRGLSRRIGLGANGALIPLQGGARLSGRLGGQQIGIMTMHTGGADPATFEYQSSSARTIGVDLTVSRGGFYSGRSADVSGSVRGRFAPHVNVSVDYERTAASLQRSDSTLRFTAQVARLRLDVATSSRLNATLVAQWDNESNRGTVHAVDAGTGFGPVCGLDQSVANGFAQRDSVADADTGHACGEVCEVFPGLSITPLTAHAARYMPRRGS